MGETPKVLIADDEPALRSLLKTNLTFEGFETVTASNGQEALERIKEEAPDVVLLDVMMPVMDGWRVLEELSKNENRHTKVILVTAKASSEAQLQGWELGCDEYLTKPFDLDVMIERIVEVTNRDQASTVERREQRIKELRLDDA
ncbi:MAG: two-component system, OmpR family, response regulator [Actinomycetota bacterium]|nr:two-component system, OmpR family, response regulator [Actinomycetota bacterium]